MIAPLLITFNKIGAYPRLHLPQNYHRVPYTCAYYIC